MANPVLDIGLFSILLGLAFFFTFYAFRNMPNGRGFLRILGVALFCILSIYIGSGYQVSLTTKGGNELTYNSTGTLIQNVTKSDTENIIISGGEDSSWVAWIFAGFAMANLIFLLRDYQGGT